MAKRAHEVLRGLEAHQLTLDDLPDGPGEIPGEDLARRYPDWSEATTFTVVGPVGNSKARGLAFPDRQDAEKYYTGLHGEPVESLFWPAPPNEDGTPNDGAGKYGLRFRLSSRNKGKKATTDE